MVKRFRSKQLSNPVKANLGESIFKSAPNGPGIYWFLSSSGNKLYVGKAKNLKNRLNQYKNATLKTASKKTLRMLNLAASLHWQCCESELCAFLCENKVLREEKPMFNRVNTRPEGYYFIGMKFFAGTSLQLILTTNPEIDGFEMFGAFKNRLLVRESFKSLLRLLWLSQVGFRLFQPQNLVRKIPRQLLSDDAIYKYDFHLLDEPENLTQKIRLFLTGMDRSFLDWLFEELLDKSQVPGFSNQSCNRLIDEDFKQLSEFYQYCPFKNNQLLEMLKKNQKTMPEKESLRPPFSGVIRGEVLDDLLSEFRLSIDKD